MTDFCFIHAADIHLDTPMRGLATYPGAPVEAMHGATRRAFDNLVQLAIDERAAFVVIAGDVFDGDWRDFNTGLYFAAGMARLGAAGIRVAMIQGNHDAQTVITRDLRLPDNVTRLSSERVETIRWDDLGVAIHGRGFGRRAETANIAATYPDRLAGHVNIGVLHTSLAGSAEHDTYAPCDEADLVAKGYDYWALGHVHARRIVRERPWIVYPGNTQGRHARETGAKGAMLVRVAGGRVERPEFRALDAARWETLEIDADGCADGDEVTERIELAARDAVDAAQGRPAALRLHIAGRTAAHRDLAANRDRWIAETRRTVTAATGMRGWVEKIKWNTSAPATDVPATDVPAPDFGIDLARLADDPELVATAIGGFAEDDEALFKKLPHDARPSAISPGDDHARALVADACTLLVARLDVIGGER